MRILFLGDVVGISGCSKLTNNLLNEIDTNKIEIRGVKYEKSWGEVDTVSDLSIYEDYKL